MKKMQKQGLYLFFTLIALVSSARIKAADNPIITYLDGSKNQIAVDSVAQSMDSMYFDPSYNNDLIKPYDTKNVITFRLDEDSKVVLPNTFTATVTLRIIYDKPNNTLDSIQQTLTINYRADSIYTGRYSYVFNGAHNVKIKVISKNIPSAVTAALLVENEIIPNRLYKFACLSKQIKAIKATDTSTDGLTVSWISRVGADEYDLEWTYIDSSAVAAGLYSTPAQIFNNGATRVSVAYLKYNIPLIFPGSGTLYIRVRPVHIQNGTRIAAAWSSDYLPDGLLQYIYNRGHEQNLNWQSTISYAEEGKRKAVVQYYDGSLRSRQTVTKNNTNNFDIVGETFYDYQGRPTIQVLPVPTLTNVIQYSQNFNKGLNGVEYDKSLFDILPQDSAICGLAAPAMDSTAGAALYYSTNNIYKTNAVYKFIPQAKGYPFSQMEYTQDNTGRISRQSGVGPTFMLGSNHETKYFYSITPDQTELDALFGTEVGERTHYFKNFVQDANGQYSVSYVDMHGRTIATALAGNSPSKLSALDSYDTATITETIADASTNITKGKIMESHKSVMVTKDGLYSFHYDLSPQSLQLNTCNATQICYDCLYDLVITISDDCGNKKLGGQPVVIKKSNFSLQTIDTSCNNPGFNIDTSVFLQQGNYEVTKTLTANTYAQAYYKDSIYTKKNVCKTLQTFISEQKAAMQQSLCTPTCATCLANVGTFTEYKHNYLLKVVGDTANEAPYLDQVQSSYKEALAACNQFCEIEDTTKNYVRGDLLLDMTAPSGQYANIDSTQNIYSIFYTGNGTPIYKAGAIIYLNENGKADSVFDNTVGTLVRPQDLSPEDFARNFKPSWANALLPYHPEYCKLQSYESHLDSYNWDNAFEKVNTYAQAAANGYATPLSSSSAHRDPLYTTSFYTPLLNAYNNYQTITNGSTTYNLSMWQMATLMVKCPTGDQTCALTFLNNPNTTLPCAADSNMAWKDFQQLYLSKKRDLLNQSYYDLACTRPGGTNITSQNLVATFHTLNFLSTSAALSQGNLSMLANTTDTAVLKAAVQDSLHNMYQSTCQSYAEFWMQQLADGYTQQQVNEIIPMLVNVCRKGSDIDHPFGSRNIGPDSAYTYSGFDAVIQAYNTAHGLTTNLTRNADVLTIPGPYNAPPVYTKQVITKPEQAECDKINIYYQQYNAYKQTNETFSQFLLRTQNTVISDADLTILLNTCSTSANGSCTYLDHAISLPPIFQKNSGSACIGCTQMNELYSQYKLTYSDTVTFKPRITNQTDTTQQKVNQVFAAFMNNKLGFSYTAVDYLDFMAKCSDYTTTTSSASASGCVSCDSLQTFVTGYFNSLGDMHADSAIERNMLLYIRNQLSLKGLQTDTLTIRNALETCQISFKKNMALTLRNGTYIWRFQRSENLQVGKDNKDFSFETWLYLGNPPIQNGIQPILTLANTNFYSTSWKNTPYDGYYLYLDSGKLNFILGDSSALYNQGGALWIKTIDNISRFKWLHLVVKKSSNFATGLNFYIDGQQVNTTVVEGCDTLNSGNIKSTGCQLLLFGNSCGGGSAPFDHAGPAILRNLRWYRRALDQNEITADYHSCTELPYNYDSLKLWCKMDDGYGAVKDYSAYHTTGTWGVTDTTSTAWWGGRGPAVCDSCRIHISNVLCYIQPPITGPMLCGRSAPAYPERPLDTINSCTDSIFYAVSTGTEMYKAYMDSSGNSFDSIYNAKCLKAYQYENFTVTHWNGEYHYTLYYYDQAGNLVQTVPPRAVHPNRTAAFLQQVKTRRAASQQLRPAHEFALATRYLYNTLNQAVQQQSPDGGASTMYYDRLGRLVLSQNAKQQPGSKYSYTGYDVLGRITEVGELTNSAAMNAAKSKTPSQLATWLSNAAATRTQVTSTVYDEAYLPLNGLILTARNLRNRVAYTRVFATASDLSQGKHASATFYSYDIHGNADTVVQDFTIASLPAGSNRFWKTIVYQYDLISGKVNGVAYQPGQADAFYQRYTYNDDNLLTNAESSADSLYWENEAYYRYYAHGPLARAVLGQQQVQGVDYAYTLQGWLKGANTTAVNTLKDMGGDGFNAAGVARDVFGFALHYYGNNDYAPINSSVQPFAQAEPLGSAFKPLYNGNIAAMSVNILQFSKPLLYNYGYDQLNRLVSMRVYRNNPTGNLNTNIWTPTAINDYNEDIAYDGSGNITKYKRYGDNTTLMDSLSYKYYANTNKLSSIKDNVSTTAFTTDIDNQASNTNYDYDAIGNLTKDSAGGIAANGIEWTVYGKIAKITKTNGTVITYTYDAAGNRQSKKVTGATSGNGETWYVRDASGNVIGVYTVGDNTVNSGALTLSELDLYGSSRLGMLKPKLDMTAAVPTKTYMNGLGNVGYSITFTRGRKFFELTNHLGNVLATVSDKKIGVASGGVITSYTADLVSAQDYYPFGMLQNNRTYTAANGSKYRYGFNGKENDTTINGQGIDYDYGFRIYDVRIGKFLSVDPLANLYPFYTPYQFAGNMPIAAIDLDGREVKVSFDYATVTKDRTAIEVKSTVAIKVQIINLSATPNEELDLQNIALNLGSDLSEKLGGKSTSTMNLPFIFKSKGNYVTGVEIPKTPKDNKDYSVTFNTYAFADVSIANDISKVNKDAWVFALVDDVKQQNGKDAAGLADIQGGKVAIGEAQYFVKDKAYAEGRQLVLHETLHLLGATDTYPPNSGLPGTQNKNNVMYFLTPDNKRQLSPDQVVQEIMTSTVGAIGNLFKPEPYKQPENQNSKTPTQQQLKKFIKKTGSATKVTP